MTQFDDVLTMLDEGWVCGTQFLDLYIPRYGARIFEIRRLHPGRVERRRCDSHYHCGVQYEWRLRPLEDSP
jgi:hypothetical protein